MRIRFQAVLLAATASLLLLRAAPLVGQSLADLAREEHARRSQIKQPAKVLTNQDLASIPAPPTPSVAPPGTAVPADAAAATSTVDSTRATSKDDDGSVKVARDAPKGQEYWSGRVKELQDRLDHDQTLADALQSRINALTADFSARDDPAQRDLIGRNRQKALDEFERFKQSIQADRKALADLQEEARRASVPPGWLR
jgi:hypothetical protein